MKRWIHAKTDRSGSEVPDDVKKELDQVYERGVEFGEDPVDWFFISKDQSFNIDAEDLPVVYRKYGRSHFWDYLDSYIKIYHPEIYDEYLNY